jgi:hypothetical protein
MTKLNSERLQNIKTNYGLEVLDSKEILMNNRFKKPL